MLNSKMVSWRLRNVVFLAFVFSSYEFQVVKQIEGLNQGYGKKGRNVNAQSRKTMTVKRNLTLKLWFQDKIGCKIANELWSLNLYHIFNVLKLLEWKLNWIMNYEWLLIIINKLFNGFRIWCRTKNVVFHFPSEQYF